MGRKRGGLAGVWDRNKGVIKTLAPIAAGFIPGVGPLIGAGLGAAMNGLDRPGKSGIGLDIGGAITGGLSGYGGAKLGQAAKGGLASMFTAAGGGAKAAPLIPGAAVAPTASAFSPALPSAPNPVSLLGKVGRGASGALSNGGFLERNQGLIGGAATAMSNVMGNQQASNIASDAQGLRQQEFDFQKEQQTKDEERRRRMAELLMPMFMSMTQKQRT